MAYAITYPLTIRSYLGVIARCTTPQDALNQIVYHFVHLRDNFKPETRLYYHQHADADMPFTKKKVFYNNALVIYDGNGIPIDVAHLDAHFGLTRDGIYAMHVAMRREQRNKKPRKKRKGMRSRCGDRGRHKCRMWDHTPGRTTMRSEMLDIRDHDLHHAFPKHAERGYHDYDDYYRSPYQHERNWKAHRSTQYR